MVLITHSKFTDATHRNDASYGVRSMEKSSGFATDLTRLTLGAVLEDAQDLSGNLAYMAVHMGGRIVGTTTKTNFLVGASPGRPGAAAMHASRPAREARRQRWG